MATTYVLGEHDMVELNGTERNWADRERIFVMKNRLDFSLENVTGDTDGIVQALAIPAGTAVLAVWLNVITADAGVTDVDVGLAAGTEFMEAVSLATTGLKFDATAAENGIGGATHGLMFSSADTIDISIQDVQTADTLVVDIYALCVDMTA
jgi:hypothetical protein